VGQPTPCVRRHGPKTLWLAVQCNARSDPDLHTSYKVNTPNSFSRCHCWEFLQVIAHSVGCWNAFEFLQLARERGLRMPSRVFLSAMANPTIPLDSRPWRQQHLLSEEQFKVCWGPPPPMSPLLPTLSHRYSNLCISLLVDPRWEAAMTCGTLRDHRSLA